MNNRKRKEKNEGFLELAIELKDLLKTKNEELEENEENEENKEVTDSDIKWIKHIQKDADNMTSKERWNSLFE